MSSNAHNFMQSLQCTALHDKNMTEVPSKNIQHIQKVLICNNE